MESQSYMYNLTFAVILFILARLSIHLKAYARFVRCIYVARTISFGNFANEMTRNPFANLAEFDLYRLTKAELLDARNNAHRDTVSN